MFRVTEILAPHAGYENVPEHYLVAAQGRGTDVHTYCIGYARNVWVEDLPPVWRGYGVSFTRWYDAHVEELVFSEGRLEDPVLGFTGQPDLVVRMKFKTGNRLLDLKTAAVDSKTWLLQLSAYWHLLHKKGIEIVEAGCLMLDRDGGQPDYIPHPNFVRDFSVFYGLLQGHHYLYQEKEAA